MKTYELLSSPDKWTTGTSARNIAGTPVNVQDSGAVSFCMMGAVARCYEKNDARLAAIDRIMPVLRAYNEFRSVPPSLFNDTHTYEEVIQVLRRADV